MVDYKSIILDINSKKTLEAKNKIKLLIDANKNDHNLYNFYGVCEVLDGNINDSIIWFKKCINLNDKNFDAYHNLALNLNKIDPADSSIDYYFKRSLEGNDYNKILGYGFFLSKKKSHEAEIYYHKALKLKPEIPLAYVALLDFYIGQKEYHKGLQIGAKAIENSISHEGVYYNLGLINQKLQNFDKAIKYYNNATNINPNHSDTYNNLGLIYHKLGDINLAEKHFQKALSINPKSSAAFNNLGTVYLKSKRLINALKCYKQCIRLAKNNYDAFNNLGQLFKVLNKYNIAVKYYKKAIQLNNKDSTFFSNYLYTLPFDPTFKNLYFDEVKKINNYFVKNNISINPNLKVDKKKLGFVSGDFKKHPVGFFLKDTLKELKKNFQIYCYTNSSEVDSITEEIKSHSDKWTEIFNLSTDESKQTIQKDGVYSLFDLSGHTSMNRLDIFASRSAPLQISWCGWLASTGLKEMDYFVIDKNIYHKNLKNYFSEDFIVLDNIWNAYALDKVFLDGNYNLPLEKNGFVTYGAFHNAAKINYEVIYNWSKILNNNKNAKLHLLARDFGDPSYIKKTIKKFNSFQIFDDRLIFSGSKPRDEFLKMYNEIDILLDTWPYGGGSSSFETIGMNVPLLTLSGQNFLERCGMSINKNLGFENMITNSLDEYTATASNIDLNYLKDMKKNLINTSKKNLTLFNSAQFAYDLTDKLSSILK